VTLSDFRRGRRPYGCVAVAISTTSGSPPITQITFRTCRAHYPGGSGQVLVGFFPVRAAFPQSQRGRHPQLHFRGLLKLHSRYGLPVCSPAQGQLCHKAPIQQVARPNRLSATTSYRQLHGWDFHPPVICAVGAHWEIRASGNLLYWPNSEHGIDTCQRQFYV